MISVIICSVKPDYLDIVAENIASTIGVPYELITIDNRNSSKGIGSVYNDAAALAKTNYLCFVHEDVRFHKVKWGEKIVQLLSIPEIGLVGVSGSIYKSKFPATWSSCDKSLYRTNSIQHFNGKEEPVISYFNPDNISYCETVLVDGVFMATRKNVWLKNRFDEKHFKGFHGYDLDLSFSIRENHKVVVSFDILLEHFSEGNLNKDWLSATNQLHKKWNRRLPMYSVEVSQPIAVYSDFLSVRNYLSVILQYGGHKLIVLRYYLLLMTKYFRYNKLTYTKTVFRYLIRR